MYQSYPQYHRSRSSSLLFDNRWFWIPFGLLGSLPFIVGLCVFLAMPGAGEGPGDPINYTPTYPYVAVYGSSGCPIVGGIRRWLDEKEIPYSFHSADYFEVFSYMEERIAAEGIDTTGEPFVFIDVNGRFLLNPTPQDVLLAYRGYPGGSQIWYSM